jgi:murein DD-endopeptidase MepM/ murein hydrolase activator NlpD
VKGATLTAGQAVGLVGATGHATGPHLHLQHQPATSWPQQEPWFESFAGKAFTWSDAGTGDDDHSETRSLAAAAVSGPVFQVVPAVEATSDVVYFNAVSS